MYSLHNNYSYYCSKKYWHNGIIGLSSVFAVSLPFIELGVDSVTLPALNGGLSGAVDIPIGFSLGNSTQTVVYVSTWPSQSMHHSLSLSSTEAKRYQQLVKLLTMHKISCMM